MALKETPNREYEIDTHGFEGVEFTESSKDVLTWPKAVKFAADQNTVLQSGREAGAFSIQANGKDAADRHQATRTGAIYFKDGNKFYVAFDDTPDAAQNIILARVQEGYTASSIIRDWVLPKSDKHIAQILKRAEKSDRIVEIVESELELVTKASVGSSEFGSNDKIQALLGDVAEPYAGMLHKRGHIKGFVNFLTLEKLNKTIDDQNAAVLPVGLGNVNVNVYVVYANNLFGDSGHARGIRGAREFSK